MQKTNSGKNRTPNNNIKKSHFNWYSIKINSIDFVVASAVDSDGPVVVRTLQILCRVDCTSDKAAIDSQPKSRRKKPLTRIKKINKRKYFRIGSILMQICTHYQRVVSAVVVVLVAMVVVVWSTYIYTECVLRNLFRCHM